MRQRQRTHNPITVVDAGTMARLDALLTPGSGLFFQRELEYMIPEVLRTKIPARNFQTMIPIGTGIPVGATSYTQKMLEPLGIADWISNYADDLPAVGVAAKEEPYKIKECGASFQYSLEEIESAQFAGVSLTNEQAIAARLAVEEKLNRVAWYGDSTVGLLGVLNHPFIPRQILSDPIGPGTAADTIVAMLNALVNSVVTLTQGVARPTRLAMAIEPYSYIASTPRSTGTDTTILAFFLANNPYIQEVVPVHELAGAGPAGEDLLLAYTPDPRVMRFELVRPFTMRPAQERNLAFVVNCHARTGGIHAPYPLEMVIGETPPNP